ncbi:hypothetical protein [Mycolicibacterium goodii]|uniref:Uncharacterized protein n=1 Tax=Mycolicibacterium goodii TaxID=134601 RepID=A0ABS6HXS4_MYCGD|nr:hypothetical protein [Mycolicibacterium goodii]MBU8827474.1 hypothetical protein [Mycolicibacterium goodii]MBU8841609.1 hypothetical protein [Mycolicibacterium goodii]
MKTTTGKTLFVFNHPAPELLEKIPTDYYCECQIAGAGSVEIELSDHNTVIVSATRYLPVDADVAAIVDHGVLQVLCTRVGREPVVMSEFPDWTSYTVRRSAR